MWHTTVACLTTHQSHRHISSLTHVYSDVTVVLMYANFIILREVIILPNEQYQKGISLVF